MKLVQFVKDFVREEDGAAAIEYALIAALIAILIVTGATALGTNLGAFFQAIADYLVTLTGGIPGGGGGGAPAP